MTNPEHKSINPMHLLKDAKYALNAGKPKQAYDSAQDALKSARERKNPREEAFSLHRIGSALALIGLDGEAERHMGSAHSILESLDSPDYLAQGIVERDIALLIAESHKSPEGRNEAAEWHERAMASHEIASGLPSTLAQRAKLELATTAAFGHRLAALENRYDYALLWNDAREIRDLRGITKPGYELTALDWATRYESSTVKILKALPRAAFLSLQVGNPVTPIRMDTRPVTRFLSNRLE